MATLATESDAEIDVVKSIRSHLMGGEGGDMEFSSPQNDYYTEMWRAKINIIVDPSHACEQ